MSLTQPASPGAPLPGFPQPLPMGSPSQTLEWSKLGLDLTPEFQDSLWGQLFALCCSFMVSGLTLALKTGFSNEKYPKLSNTLEKVQKLKNAQNRLR